jgi:hypothetical protein
MQFDYHIIWWVNIENARPSMALISGLYQVNVVTELAHPTSKKVGEN